MKTINTAVDVLITQPYKAYRDTAINNEKLARIKKATARASLARHADDIADVVDRERKLPPTTLRDAIRKEARSVSKDLQKENASLKAQINKLAGTGKGKGNGKGKPDFRSKGSTAGRASKSNTKKQGDTAGPGNATAAAKKKQGTKNSNNKSGGRKKASTTGKGK